MNKHADDKTGTSDHYEKENTLKSHFTLGFWIGTWQLRFLKNKIDERKLFWESTVVREQVKEYALEKRSLQRVN